MNQAYLVTGTNIGNRSSNLAAANELIKQNCGEIIRCSSIYETEPWGNTNQSSFLNQALCINTALDPANLLSCLLSIEKKLGRVRKEKYGPRIIDIDIIFYNQEVIDESKLQIPHPEMQHRLFVLFPLSEIASEFIHPVFNITIREMLEQCNDQLTVKKFLIV